MSFALVLAALCALALALWLTSSLHSPVTVRVLSDGRSLEWSHAPGAPMCMYLVSSYRYSSLPYALLEHTYSRVCLVHATRDRPRPALLSLSLPFLLLVLDCSLFLQLLLL